MKVVVIGAGDMGASIANRAVRSNEVSVRGSTIGSKSAALVIQDSHGTITEATDENVGTADLVIVAVPWASFDDTLTLLSGTNVRHVVSAVVPWTGDDAEPAVGRDDSVAERFARGLPNASVAGAFTTVAAATIRGIDSYAERPTVFVASDDAATKLSVRELAESMGFDTLDAGPLYAARFTEAMGFLWTAAAFQGGAGKMLAFRAVLPQ